MRKFMSTLLAGLFALGSVAGFAADPPKATVVIESEGLLYVSIADANFGTQDYSFEDEEYTQNVVVVAKDDTGTGAGWNVTLTGTDFTRTTPTAATFGVDNMALVGGAIATDAGQEGDGNITVTQGDLHNSTPLKILSAQPMNGMGHYTVTFTDSTLNVPGGTLVGSYQSNLTISISTGP